jgi:hypothetical protein
VSIAASELAQSGFTEDNRSYFFQVRHHETVALGDMIFEYDRAKGRRHARDVGLIFDDNRNAVERPAEARSLEVGVEPVRFFESF